LSTPTIGGGGGDARVNSISNTWNDAIDFSRRVENVVQRRYSNRQNRHLCPDLGTSAVVLMAMNSCVQTTDRGGQTSSNCFANTLRTPQGAT